MSGHWASGPNWVLPNLLLGGYVNEAHKSLLQAFKVTHILQVGTELQPSHLADFDYMHILVDDLEHEDIGKHFTRCINFIEAARAIGGVVLVHCMAGVSRSATVVAAYLMWKDKLTPQEALDKIKSARPVIFPNRGFVLQLKLFHQLINSPDSPGQPGWPGWTQDSYMKAVQESDSVCNELRCDLGDAWLGAHTAQRKRPAAALDKLTRNSADCGCCKQFCRRLSRLFGWTCSLKSS